MFRFHLDFNVDDDEEGYTLGEKNWRMKNENELKHTHHRLHYQLILFFFSNICVFMCVCDFHFFSVQLIFYYYLNFIIFLFDKFIIAFEYFSENLSIPFDGNDYVKEFLLVFFFVCVDFYESILVFAPFNDIQIFSRQQMCAKSNQNVNKKKQTVYKSN